MAPAMPPFLFLLLLLLLLLLFILLLVFTGAAPRLVLFKRGTYETWNSDTLGGTVALITRPGSSGMETCIAVPGEVPGGTRTKRSF